MRLENFVILVMKINLLAAVLVGVVLLAAKLLKNRYSVSWKYSMWIVIAVFLLFPISLVSHATVWEIEVPAASGKAGNASAKQTADGAADRNTVKTADQNENKTEDRSINETTGKTASRTTDKTTDKIMVTGIPAAAANFCIRHLYEIFLTLWLGVGLLLAVIRISRYRLSIRRIRRWSVPVEDPEANRIYRSMCRERCMKRVPRLVVNSGLSTPLLVGVLRPTLYLPKEAYREEEYRLIFAHELSHYMSGDLIYKLLLLLVKTVYWFNPMLYVMAREGDKDVEYLCDSRVVKDFSHSECMRYNRLLLKTAKNQADVRLLCAGLNDGVTAFKDRVRNIMTTRKRRKGIFLIPILTLTLVLSNSLIGCTAKTERADKPAIEENTAGTSTDKSTRTDAVDKSDSGTGSTDYGTDKSVTGTDTAGESSIEGNNSDENTNAGQESEAQESEGRPGINFKQNRIGWYSNSSDPTVSLQVTDITNHTIEFTLLDLKKENHLIHGLGENEYTRVTRHAIGQIVDENTVKYKDENYDITITWNKYEKNPEILRKYGYQTDPRLVGILTFSGTWPEDSSLSEDTTAAYTEDSMVRHVS